MMIRPTARRRRLLAAAGSLLTLGLLGVAAPAEAIVKGEVVPGGWAGDRVPAVNLYGFVGRMAVGCTASLVAPGVALTAGHCGKVTGTKVWFGVLNADRDTGVERTIVKQQNLGDAAFSAGASILVVWLDRPVREVAPVALARPDQGALWSGGSALSAYGWGQINDPCIVGGRTVPTAELRRTGMKIVDTAVSTGIYRNLAKVRSLGAGHPSKGDSGGPLIAQEGAGRPYLVGVFQAAVGLCKGKNYAYYYNRVWTQQKLRDYVNSQQR